MKNECNLITNDEGDVDSVRIQLKKHGSSSSRKSEDGKRQKVDFVGHLNDSKAKSPADTTHVKRESDGSHSIDELFNQNGSLTHLSTTLNQISSDRRKAFTSSCEERCCGLGSLTHSDLGKHVYSLRTEYVQRLARPLLVKLMAHPSNRGFFNMPVDPIAHGVPTYLERIKRPMDLGTIRSNVQRGSYKTIEEVFADIVLVFHNAISFNARDTQVHKFAAELLKEAETDIALLKDKCMKENKLKQSHNCSLCSGSLCLICGEKCLKFETPVLVCQGSCAQKVKKNSVFYITSDSNMLWCQKCYNSLPAVISAEYPTGVAGATAPLLKKQLLKRRSDEEVAEPWVECDDCGFWVHQICALYNDLEQEPLGQCITEGDDRVKFSCPLCRLERASGVPRLSLQGSKSRCEELPEETPLVLRIKTSPRASSSASAAQNAGMLTPVARVTSNSSYVVEGFNGSLPDCIARTNLYLDGSAERCAAAAAAAAAPMDVDTLVVSEDNRSLQGSEDTGDDTTTDSVVDEALHTSSTAMVLLDDYEILDKKECDPLTDPDNLKYLSFNDAKLRLASMFQLKMDVMERFHRDRDPSDANAVSPLHSSAHDALSLAEGIYSFISSPVTDHDKKSNFVAEDNAANKAKSVTIHIEDDEDRSSRMCPLDSVSAAGIDSCGVSYLSDTCSVHSNCDDFPSNDASSTRDADSCSQDYHSLPHRHDAASDVHWKWRASALPRTHISDFLELMVKEMLTSSGYADAAGSITIRMTSNCDFKMDVPGCIVQNMMTAQGKVIPDSMGYRQKCILLFQAIDGVDVCLFCLYVQEFDATCPAPNTSTVYIAYLDSVDYFRPMEARTLVYHELVVAYLKWSQARGFQSAHIWSCPPQRGDSFILWCHPGTQRTPSRDRLNNWYNAILLRCSKLGILDDISSLYTRFFTPYNQAVKRDESQHRQAAKNSFVGSGLAKQTSSASLTGLGKSKESASNLVTLEEAATAALDTVPVAPPIFEGDFWILEYLRLTRQLANKAKPSAGGAAGGGAQRHGANEQQVNQRRCRDYLKQLTVKSIAHAFLHPVDPVALNIPTYPLIVTHPMDLSTVKEKLRLGSYPTMLDFAKDIRLIFANAMLFNPPSHMVHINANCLLRDFHNTLLDLMAQEGAGAVDANGQPLQPMPRTSRTDALDTTSLDLFLQTLSLQLPAVSGCTSAASTPRPGAAAGVESQESLNSIPVHVEALVRSQMTDSEGMDVVPAETAPVIPGATRMVRHVTEQEPEPAPFNPSYANTPLSTASSMPSSTFSFDFGIDDPEDHSLTGELRRKRSISHMSEDMSGLDLLPLVRTDSLDSGYSGSLNFDRCVRRRDSMDSICSSTVDMANHYQDSCRRPLSFFPGGMNASASYGDLQAAEFTRATEERFSAAAFNAAHVPKPFDKVNFTGGRAAMNVVHELSKCVQRLKDDLFVIRFASPSQVAGPAAAAAAAVEPKAEGEFPVPPPVVPVKRHRGRAAVYIKKAGPKCLPSEKISAVCLAMLTSLAADTSDPDPPIFNSLVNTRHTLLEMCQYRHYQFDSLRRAKHSSLMLLYHLQNPTARCTRVLCCQCHEVIRNIRWHCDQCPNYDVCNACNLAQSEPTTLVDDKTCVNTRLARDVKIKRIAEEDLLRHTHPMTPYRVSYV